MRIIAMRAAEAAKNTSDLIEGTVKRISNGSELVIKTNEAFSGVTSSSTKVGELVEGTKNYGRTNKKDHQTAVRKSSLKARKPKGPKSAPTRKVKTIDRQKVDPEQVIPFEDDDFKDFCDRKQRTEVRSQKTDDREQTAAGGGPNVDFRDQKYLIH